MLPLILLGKGEKAKIVEIKSNSQSYNNCIGRIENMGIRVGKIVEIVHVNIKGPILVRVNNSRIAIGKGVAMKIFVEKITV